MHILMNGAYNFFTMSGGAAGELEANVFKAMAIILSLVYVQLLIRKGKPRAVTGANLWLNRTAQSQYYAGSTYIKRPKAA